MTALAGVLGFLAGVLVTLAILLYLGDYSLNNHLD